MLKKTFTSVKKWISIVIKYALFMLIAISPCDWWKVTGVANEMLIEHYCPEKLNPAITKTPGPPVSISEKTSFRKIS